MNKFSEIFKDDNDWNEKSVIGFIAFGMMCLVLIADLICSFCGCKLEVEKFVYDTFFWIVLGCFGISATENIAGKKTKSKDNSKPYEKAD